MSLDDFIVAELPKDQPLRFPIQDVYRFDERRILAGRVESGSVKVGDRLIFCPGNKAAPLRQSSVGMPRRASRPARANPLALRLRNRFSSSAVRWRRSKARRHAKTDAVQGACFWLGRNPFRRGKLYKLKLATQEVDCEIEAIHKVIDASSLETISRKEIFVGRHEVAEISIRTKRPVAFDAHSKLFRRAGSSSSTASRSRVAALSRWITIPNAAPIRPRAATIFTGAATER